MASADINDVITIASSGMQAQSKRMKVVAENIANADTTPNAPNQQPYQRQIVTFKSVFDRALGAEVVKVTGVTKDKSEFIKKFDPAHPAADSKGYVLMPNVKPVVETMDLREAQRSFEANLNVVESARNMMMRTIDLLR